MKNWNLIAAMILVAIFAVSCGDEDPNTNIGGTCTEENAMMCDGSIVLKCTSGTWQSQGDCADYGYECVEANNVAGCSNTGTDTDTPVGTDTDTPVGTDTDTPTTNCGNSVTDTGEVCDGDAKNCVDISASYTGGVAMCKSDCTGYDTANCQGAADTDNVQPDSDTTTTGGTCSDINTCIGDANGGSGCADQACVDACLATGTTEAQAQFNAVMTCITNNCATECDGTNDTACSTCQSEKCGDELDACFTVDVPAYGTMAANANFAYIYDGDGDLNAQLQANSSGAIMSGVLTGSYAASNKPIPPTGGVQTYSIAVHSAADGTNPASVAVQQVVQTQTAIVNPVAILAFASDVIAPGQFTVDLTQEATAMSYLINVDANNNQCLLAFVSGGTVNVTAATNTTAASGGSIAFNATNLKLYHPTETPFGDISGQLGSTTACPKE